MELSDEIQAFQNVTIAKKNAWADRAAGLEKKLADVKTERSAYLFILTEYSALCPPDYALNCDMIDCASRTVGCWKRWAEETAKEKESL